MNEEIPSNLFQARDTPLSPDTQQLVEDFTARMEVMAKQTDALIIAAIEAAVKKAEEPPPRQHRWREAFSPMFGWVVPRRSPRPQRPQPPVQEEDIMIIDVPYRVIDRKE